MSTALGVRPGDPRLQRALEARDSHGSWLLDAMIWLQFLIMIVPEGFDYSALTLPMAPPTGSATARVLWFCVLAYGGVLLLMRRPVLRRIWPHVNPWLPWFLLLSLASLAWSIDPGLTARRDIRFVTIFVICLAAALTGWNQWRFQQIQRRLLTGLMAGSLLFGLAFPELAIHQETAPELLHAWRGLTNHKNSLGDLACLSLLLWLHAGFTQERPLWRAIGGVLLSMLCVVLSRSGTAFANSAALGVLMPCLLFLPARARRHLPLVASLMVAVAVIYSLAVLDLIPGSGMLLTPIAQLTGKDLTFTGRTTIWHLVTEHIHLHPLLGTGYGAYWLAGAEAGTDSYVVYWAMGAFYPGSAHNGYLDVLNDLGIVGLLLLLAYLVNHLRGILALMRVRYAQAVLYLVLFLQQMIGNLTESHWLSVRSVDVVLMTLASMGLARELAELRRRGAVAGTSR